MPGTPRDLLKTRRSRIAEVYYENSIGAGGADSQLVGFGCLLSVGATNTQLAVTAGEFVIAQAVTSFVAVAGQAVPAGAVTAAGQFLKVLVESDVSGALTLTPGAISTVSQAAAVLPALTAARVGLGWIEVPAAFTPGTTPLTAAMLKQVPYWGSN